MTFQSGAMLAVCGAFLIAALILTVFAIVRHPARQSPKQLFVEPFIDALRYAYPPHFDKGVSNGRSFAVLSVRNVGERDLLHIVARCILESGEEIPCFWSRVPGKQFARGGSYAADIKRADVRLLIIGQVFAEDKLWARLPEKQEDVFDSHSRASRMDGVEIVRFISRAGETVDIERKMVLTVTFQATERLDESGRFRLGFKRQRVGGSIGLRRETWQPDIVAA